MDYKIVEKDKFKVIGAFKKFRYDSAFMEVPAFWNEHISQGKLKEICGMYGVNIDVKVKWVGLNLSTLLQRIILKKKKEWKDM